MESSLQGRKARLCYRQLIALVLAPLFYALPACADYRMEAADAVEVSIGGLIQQRAIVQLDGTVTVSVAGLLPSRKEAAPAGRV